MIPRRACDSHTLRRNFQTKFSLQISTRFSPAAKKVPIDSSLGAQRVFKQHCSEFFRNLFHSCPLKQWLRNSPERPERINSRRYREALAEVVACFCTVACYIAPGIKLSLTFNFE
jgi:hypothetical protein